MWRSVESSVARPDGEGAAKQGLALAEGEDDGEVPHRLGNAGVGLAVGALPDGEGLFEEGPHVLGTGEVDAG